MFMCKRFLFFFALQGEYAYLIGLGSTFLVLYVLGIPTLFGSFVFLNRKKIVEGDPIVKRWLGFLFSCYKQKRKAELWYGVLFITFIFCHLPQPTMIFF